MFVTRFVPLMEADIGASGGAPATDGGVSNSGAPAAAPPAPNQAPAKVNPLLVEPASETQPAQQQPPATPAQPGNEPEILDFGGRKVPVVDPVLKELHRDYSNLQGTYTRTTQQLQQLEQQNQMLVQMVQVLQQQMQQAAQQQPQPPAEPQLTPEEIEARKEAFMNRFYEDPMGAIGELLQQQLDKAVKPVIEPLKQTVEPIVRERQLQQQMQQLAMKYQDFRDMIPAMQDVLREQPHLEQLGLETVYLVAKGRVAQSQPPAPKPEELLADPQFQQMILQNQEIQQKVISQYMQNKQQSQQAAPPTIGSQPGGSAPAVPPEKPKTLREASKLFLRHWGQG